MNKLYLTSVFLFFGMCLVVIFAVLGHLGGQKFISWINDEDYKPPKWFPRLVGHLIGYEDCQIVNLIGAAVLSILFSAVISLLWPLSLVVVIIIVSAHLLRFAVRAKKNTKKIAEFLHKHPETVETENVDLPFWSTEK